MGAAVGDYDNDGDLDWFVSSIYDPNMMAEANWGIICFDYDRDGDIDLFVANNSQSPKLFRNDGGNTYNFLNIKLNGLSPNTEGVWARVTITTGSKVQMRELRAGSNFVSQNPVLAHFGLAESELVDQVQVRWLDGQITVLENVAPNQFLTIDHPNL